MIGITLMTTSNPFFVTLGEAAEAEAKKHGFDVKIAFFFLDLFDYAVKAKGQGLFIIKNKSAFRGRKIHGSG